MGIIIFMLLDSRGNIAPINRISHIELRGKREEAKMKRVEGMQIWECGVRNERKTIPKSEIDEGGGVFLKMAHGNTNLITYGDVDERC